MPCPGAGAAYPNGVAEAVLLSLEAVQADDRGGVCAGVLELVCVLSAAGVRRDLLPAPGRRARSAPGLRWMGPGWTGRWGAWRSGRW